MRNTATLFTIIFFLYSALEVSAQGLVSSSANGNLVYQKYANQGQTNAVNTVPDFSMCGYMGGGVALPLVPVVETVSPGSGDDQSRIQAAINRVSALPVQNNGFRGAILLQKGIYEVDGTLNINASGIVLRGEGQGADGTRIIATGTGQRTLISVSGTGSVTEVSGSRQLVTSSYVPVGVSSFTVASASGFSVGSRIIVLRTPNDKWINDLNMAQYGWTAEEYKTDYERVVVAKNGNTITIDAPIVQAMETQYGGGAVYLYTYPGRIQQVGIESLCLESAFASDSDENHAWDGIKFQHIENGWVKNVTAQYFGRSCFDASTGSKSVTVEECAMLDPKSQTTGGRKYPFVIDRGQFILIQRCFSRGGRHDYAMGYKVPGPNAFVDCIAIQTSNDIGPHHRYSTGCLFDNIKGGLIRVQNRGSFGTGQGWAGAQTMFWNCEGQMKVESPIGALNWGIGCTGTQTGAGYWESFGTHVSPRSLYLKQLEERLGIGAVNNIAAPQQLLGTIWQALSNWAGEGKLFGSAQSGEQYIVDNTDGGFSTAGTWTASTGLAGYYGSNYLHDGDNLASSTKSATWTSPITTTGTYQVYLRWTSAADRPDAAPVEVNYNGGIANLTVNQQLNGGQWVKIGTWSFTGGSGDYVKLSAADAGYTIADAVRWVKVSTTGRMSSEAGATPSADHPDDAGFTAFPNPAAQILTIRSRENLTNASIRVSSVLGQKARVPEVSRDAEAVNLDVSGLSNGVYLLSVHNKGRKTTKKIIIKK